LHGAITKGSYGHEKGGGVIHFSKQRQAPPTKEDSGDMKEERGSRPRAEERDRTKSITSKNIIIRERNKSQSIDIITKCHNTSQHLISTFARQ